MIKEKSASTALQVDANENKISYLWLNGERVIGIEGLEIFKDCKQLHQLPAIEKNQRDELNNIINDTLQRYAEDGICDYWPSLVTKAKEYFSEKGYCVTSQGRIEIELRQSIEIATPYSFEKKAAEKMFTQADLWNIHRMRRVRLQRRYIGG